jgi:hypothetical protein
MHVVYSCCLRAQAANGVPAGGVWLGNVTQPAFDGTLIVFHRIPLYNTKTYVSWELGLAR